MVHRSLFLIAALCLLAVGPSARADFVIPQWAVGVTVHDSSSGQHESSVFATPQNPFQASHSVNIGISTSASVYTFDWTADAGSFLIEAAQQAEDIDTSTLMTRSAGSIWVEASSELSLEISAFYDYYLPPGMMMAILEISAFDVDTSDILFYGRERVDSYDGYPATGRLAIDGNTTFPVGHTSIFSYKMSIYSSAGQTGLLGTGNGSVDFQITPEPATLSLLALAAAPLLLRPRRRR